MHRQYLPLQRLPTDNSKSGSASLWATQEGNIVHTLTQSLVKHKAQQNMLLLGNDTAYN